MSNSLSIPALARLACVGLISFSGTGCGGNEPAPQVPEPTPEAQHEEAGRIGVSAEIGGLNEEKVDKTFQSALGDFQRCLADGAKRVEFLGGSLNFFVEINSGGKVDHAHLEKSTLGDRQTEKCMLDSLRGKRWPKPVGGLHGLARKAFDFDPPNDVRAPTSWDSERMSAVVGRLSRQLSACKNGHKGAFEATLYVATDGSVLSAGVTPPDSAGEAAVDCLVDTLQGASLPSPGSWPAKVTFSL
jgi:hypothetical protein